MTQTEQLYRSLYRIRYFEEYKLECFPKAVFFGTTHASLGQEANAIGVLHHCREHDIVVSNHRCHGHFLAYGGDMRALFAELMGRKTGVCGGRGGSQHLHWRNFYSNGVLGGTIPIATGMALAEKYKHSDAVTFAFLGDGTMGEGVLYESLNMAALWKLPIFYVVEDNRIAQTTPVEKAVAGEMKARFLAFGIPTHELDTSDVMEILPLAGRLVGEIRHEKAPRAMILRTYRFGPHSKGDDTRSPEYIQHIRQHFDPIAIHGSRLPNEETQRIQQEVRLEVENSYQLALTDPFPEVSDWVRR